MELITFLERLFEILGGCIQFYSTEYKIIFWIHENIFLRRKDHSFVLAGTTTAVVSHKQKHTMQLPYIYHLITCTPLWKSSRTITDTRFYLGRTLWTYCVWHALGKPFSKLKLTRSQRCKINNLIVMIRWNMRDANGGCRVWSPRRVNFVTDYTILPKPPIISPI